MGIGHEGATGPEPGEHTTPAVTYHPETDTYRARIETGSLRPDEAVILAVSKAADTDPGDLPPLYTVVDPDALDRLFDRDDGFDGTLSFGYAGFDVTIVDGGTVAVDASRGE